MISTKIEVVPKQCCAPSRLAFKSPNTGFAAQRIRPKASHFAKPEIKLNRGRRMDSATKGEEKAAIRRKKT